MASYRGRPGPSTAGCRSRNAKGDRAAISFECVPSRGLRGSRRLRRPTAAVTRPWRCRARQRALLLPVTSNGGLAKLLARRLGQRMLGLVVLAKHVELDDRQRHLLVVQGALGGSGGGLRPAAGASRRGRRSRCPGIRTVAAFSSTVSSPTAAALVGAASTRSSNQAIRSFTVSGAPTSRSTESVGPIASGEIRRSAGSRRRGIV